MLEDSPGSMPGWGLNIYVLHFHAKSISMNFNYVTGCKSAELFHVFSIVKKVTKGTNAVISVHSSEDI